MLIYTRARLDLHLYTIFNIFGAFKKSFTQLSCHCLALTKITEEVHAHCATLFSHNIALY